MSKQSYKQRDKRRRERAKQRYEAQYGDKAAWIRGLPCCVPTCTNLWPIEAAHVKSRGAGGTKEHLVPLCMFHHNEQHALGIDTFQRHRNIDLHALAEEYERKWQKRNNEPEF